MKRLMLILLLVAFTAGSAGLAEAKIALQNADSFYAENLESAVLPEESRYFEIGYRACAVPDGEQTEPGVHLIQYDLLLQNKTDRPLSNLRFTAHLRDSLQLALIAPEWYNEPMNLGARGQTALPSAAIYTWNPFVNLDNLSLLEDLAVSDFYDMLVEIEWNGGSERIRLNRECAGMPDSVQGSLDAREPLDEAELARMLEMGK